MKKIIAGNEKSYFKWGGSLFSTRRSRCLSVLTLLGGLYILFALYCSLIFFSKENGYGELSQDMSPPQDPPESDNPFLGMIPVVGMAAQGVKNFLDNTCVVTKSDFETYKAEAYEREDDEKVQPDLLWKEVLEAGDSKDDFFVPQIGSEVLAKCYL